MSDVPTPEASAPAPAPEPWPPARRPWSPWADVRTDLRAALMLLAGIALAGIPAGLLWWWLAPRAEFVITSGGPTAVGAPSPELLIAADGVLALILAGLGLVAAIAAWRLRRRRGIATLIAVALGVAAAGVVAWRLGVLLAPGPSRAELADVGGTVTTGLDLGALPVLAVGPFVAVLTYLVPAAYSAGDDLGRAEAAAAHPPARLLEPAPESSPASSPAPQT